MYNSERFLTFASKHLKIDISKESIQAAKDVAASIQAEEDPIWIAVHNPEEHVHPIMYELCVNLVHDDKTVLATIEAINAYGFGLDIYEIERVSYDRHLREITFRAVVNLQSAEYDGVAIEVVLTGTMDYTGDSFQLSNYEVLSCDVFDPL